MSGHEKARSRLAPGGFLEDDHLNHGFEGWVKTNTKTFTFHFMRALTLLSLDL